MRHEHERSPQRSERTKDAGKDDAERPSPEDTTTVNSARVKLLRPPSAQPPPVQRLPGPLSVAASPGRIHAAARDGIAGGGQPLPHLSAIQRSFGKHDVSSVTAHTGREATAGSFAMGARAYAFGDHVAFARAPSLQDAAHEAAHVVQQRAGVQLAGGVGREGDAHEQHADAVAARVAAGQSSEGLLDRYESRAGAPAPGVQRLIVNAEGKEVWKDWEKSFEELMRHSKEHNNNAFADDMVRLKALGAKLDKTDVTVTVTSFAQLVSMLADKQDHDLVTRVLQRYEEVFAGGANDKLLKPSTGKPPTAEEYTKEQDAGKVRKNVFDTVKNLNQKMKTFGGQIASKAHLERNDKVEEKYQEPVSVSLKGQSGKEVTEAQFNQGVGNKVKAKGYTHLGQMDDMTRGRFYADNMKQVEDVVSALLSQTEYKVKEITPPRSPLKNDPTLFAYPRYHVILEDPETGFTHEWQVGTRATAHVIEKKNIELPGKLVTALGDARKKIPANNRSNIHDVNYVLFTAVMDNNLAGRKMVSSELAAEISQFQEDAAALQGLSANSSVEDMDPKLGPLHAKANEILKKLCDIDKMPEFLAAHAH